MNSHVLSVEVPMGRAMMYMSVFTDASFLGLEGKTLIAGCGGGMDSIKSLHIIVLEPPTVW